MSRTVPQYLTVEPTTLRVTHHVGATAYRHAHATLQAISAMWAHTVPCHNVYHDTVRAILRATADGLQAEYSATFTNADGPGNRNTQRHLWDALQAAHSAVKAHDVSKWVASGQGMGVSNV